MGKFALMLKKEQEAEEKRKAQGVTYPTEQKVIAPSKGAANAAPIITWNIKRYDRRIGIWFRKKRQPYKT